jgi:ATP-dependent DNA helicase RecQ
LDNVNKFYVLKKYFGYDNFREGQEPLIDAMLTGRDALGIMPTGAGKSLCYQIPAMLFDGLTLVISPLISLMKDQVNTLTRLGIDAAFLNSSLTSAQYAHAMKNATDGKYKIIYIAPERLMTDDFLTFAKQSPIKMVTVDEAHCISHWGQDFRPSYLEINRFIQELPNRPVVSAFTATATVRVRDDMVNALKLKDPLVLVTGFDRKNLRFEVRHPRKKYDMLINYLYDKNDGIGIIYCSARKTVDNLCEKLTQNGYKATRYHAGLSDSERIKNQEDFIHGRIPLMVATNAFGMGIDKPDISFVLHYNMPQDMESYYQEAGRAGRDGQPADCLLFFNAQDIRTNTFLIENGEPNEDIDEKTRQTVITSARQRLREITAYCHTGDCLREYILKYFGETPPKECQNCGNCGAEMESADITVDSQKILSCIARAKERYGLKNIIDCLRGSQNKKITQFGLDKLSTYGIMKDTPEKRIRDITYYLIQNGYIRITSDDEFPIAKLGPQSREVLNGKVSLIMKLPKTIPGDSPETEASIKSGPSNPALMDALKKLRLSIAQREKVPAFVIFSGASLTDMCKRLPQNGREFLQVHGVGQVKNERYGEAFIQEIKEFVCQTV